MPSIPLPHDAPGLKVVGKGALKRGKESNVFGIGVKATMNARVEKTERTKAGGKGLPKLPAMASPKKGPKATNSDSKHDKIINEEAKATTIPEGQLINEPKAVEAIVNDKPAIEPSTIDGPSAVAEFAIQENAAVAQESKNPGIEGRAQPEATAEISGAPEPHLGNEEVSSPAEIPIPSDSLDPNSGAAEVLPHLAMQTAESPAAITDEVITTPHILDRPVAEEPEEEPSAGPTTVDLVPNGEVGMDNGDSTAVAHAGETEVVQLEEAAPASSKQKMEETVGAAIENEIDGSTTAENLSGAIDVSAEPAIDAEQPQIDAVESTEPVSIEQEPKATPTDLAEQPFDPSEKVAVTLDPAQPDMVVKTETPSEQTPEAAPETSQPPAPTEEALVPEESVQPLIPAAETVLLEEAPTIEGIQIAPPEEPIATEELVEPTGPGEEIPVTAAVVEDNLVVDPIRFESAEKPAEHAEHAEPTEPMQNVEPAAKEEVVEQPMEAAGSVAEDEPAAIPAAVPDAL